MTSVPALYRQEELTRAQAQVGTACGTERWRTRSPMSLSEAPNQRWSLDFVHDQLVGGRRFRVRNVMDDVTRECLAAVVDTSISGLRVARELTGLIMVHGNRRRS